MLDWLVSIGLGILLGWTGGFNKKTAVTLITIVALVKFLLALPVFLAGALVGGILGFFFPIIGVAILLGLIVAFIIGLVIVVAVGLIALFITAKVREALG